MTGIVFWEMVSDYKLGDGDMEGDRQDPAASSSSFNCEVWDVHQHSPLTVVLILRTSQGITEWRRVLKCPFKAGRVIAVV